MVGAAVARVTAGGVSMDMCMLRPVFVCLMCKAWFLGWNCRN